MYSDSEFRVLTGFLDADALLAARSLMAAAQYVEGVATAFDAAREVKQNLQIDPMDAKSIQPLQQLLLQAINQSRSLREAAIPKEIHDPRFAMYKPGMSYGWHVDSPLMGHPPVRTDFGMTVFLDEPDAYEGGELELQTPGGRVQFKPPAGDAVVYPCCFLHRVAPVISGQRRVMVTWIQSLVPDPGHRAILAALQGIQSRLDPQSQEALELQQQVANLTRLWIRN